VASKGSFLGRLARAILWLTAIFIVGSILAAVSLRWINPVFTAFMAEAQIAAWMSHDSSYVFRRSWVDLNRISPNLPLAVVASEDQKFPEHWGFDVAAIEKAYALNQHSHKVRGASTISQQVAKNLFLWSGRSYFRKGLEAYFTVLIESALPTGDLPEHRRVRLRHVRRRGCRPAVLSQARLPALTRRRRRARRRFAEPAALFSRGAVPLCSAAARVDTGPDAGIGRPRDAE